MCGETSTGWLPSLLPSLQSTLPRIRCTYRYCLSFVFVFVMVMVMHSLYAMLCWIECSIMPSIFNSHTIIIILMSPTLFALSLHLHILPPSRLLLFLSYLGVSLYLHLDPSLSLHLFFAISTLAPLLSLIISSSIWRHR